MKRKSTNPDCIWKLPSANTRCRLPWISCPALAVTLFVPFFWGDSSRFWERSVAARPAGALCRPSAATAALNTRSNWAGLKLKQGWISGPPLLLLLCPSRNWKIIIFHGFLKARSKAQVAGKTGWALFSYISTGGCWVLCRQPGSEGAGAAGWCGAISFDGNHRMSKAASGHWRSPSPSSLLEWSPAEHIAQSSSPDRWGRLHSLSMQTVQVRNFFLVSRWNFPCFSFQSFPSVWSSYQEVLQPVCARILAKC